MAEVRPDEITAVLRKQLSGFEKEIDIYDVGTVLQVGDGIARLYGLSKVMASELIEFPNNVFGMVLNLEEDNVGCILFGDDTKIKEGDTVKRRSALRQCPSAMRCLAASSTRLASRLTDAVRLRQISFYRSKEKHSALSSASQ